MQGVLRPVAGLVRRFFMGMDGYGVFSDYETHDIDYSGGGAHTARS